MKDEEALGTDCRVDADWLGSQFLLRFCVPDIEAGGKMSERAVKTGWHLLLVLAAIAELYSARSKARKCLIGACAVYHATAAHNDYFNGGSE